MVQSQASASSFGAEPSEANTEDVVKPESCRRILSGCIYFKREQPKVVGSVLPPLSRNRNTEHRMKCKERQQ